MLYTVDSPSAAETTSNAGGYQNTGGTKSRGTKSRHSNIVPEVPFNPAIWYPGVAKRRGYQIHHYSGGEAFLWKYLLACLSKAVKRLPGEFQCWDPSVSSFERGDTRGYSWR